MRNGTTLKLVVAGFVAVLAAGCSDSVPAGKMFTDITRRAGVELWGQSKCVAFGDFDEDGFLDLYVSVVYAPNRMFRNNRDGTFMDVTDITATGSPYDGHGAVFADFNNDGRCDLLVLTDSEHAINLSKLKQWPPNHLYMRYNTTFVDCADRSAIAYPAGKGADNRAAGVAVADIDNDGFLDVYIASGGYKISPNTLLRNVRRNWLWCEFEDITKSAGVGDPGKGYICAFADIDNDGDQDLYIGDVFKVKGKKLPYRRLFTNNGDGTFAEITRKSGIGQEGGNVGCAFGDIDNDGDLDLYVSNIGANILYLNNGDGTFVDVTAKAGVAASKESRGCIMGDVNNDGHLDIYIASEKEDFLYLNNGDGTFTHVADSGIDVPLGHGCSFGDIDNDGDLDIYVTSWAISGKPESGFFRLFRNETNNDRYIKVRVKGKTSNRSAVGARIYLYAAGHCGDKKHLVGFREVAAGTGVFSTCPLEQHFGLPKAAKHDLEVVFPTSRKTVRKLGVQPGTILDIEEPAQ